MARYGTMILAVWLLGWGLAIPTPGFPQWVVAATIFVAEVIALRVDAVRWISFAGGLYLVIAPYLFGYDQAAVAFNSFACGTTILVLAAQPTHRASYSDPTTYNQRIYRYQGGGKPYR